MTGYGRGSARLGATCLVVEMRSVNHRFLDLRMRVAPELASDGASVEDLVRKHAVRGRVDVSMRCEGEVGADLVFDEARARAALSALRALRDELAPGEALPLSLLSSVPNLFREASLPDLAHREEAVHHAAAEALEGLFAMRRQEGSVLRNDLEARVSHIEEVVSHAAAALVRVTSAQREKLLARIEKLTQGTGVALDAHRLELEVALLADRADVSEELTRLRSHASQLRGLLTADPDEAVGRRIEFLLQEMGREANTAGSKVPDAALTHMMLDIKAEIERMREQVQNVL